MSDGAGDGQQDLVLRACAGERGAFDALLLEHQARLRAVVRRMVGHPDDTDDLVQEAILRAWTGIGGFRGESSFGTWLCAIGARLALDHLRQRKRWRVEAQVVYANECFASPELQGEVMAVVADPAFRYETDEHIAYCFNCVGRSLEPQQQAALVLREVLGFTSAEAARALGVSDSVLRHTLSSARREMEGRYEGLCALVNKAGICYQCKGLREVTPAAQRGAEVTGIDDFEQRLELVRAANLERGRSQAMHDLFWRRTSELEATGGGSTEPHSGCGRDDDEA